MPDVQEVYDMVTKQKPPEHGALERQQQRQIRAARSKKIGALLVAAVISLVAIAVIVMTRPAESGTDPADVPIVDPADATAVQVATDFAEAYGAFDAEGAIGYLADGADVSVVGGASGVGTAPEEWPLNLSWWAATGYRQILEPCEEISSSASGTEVRCSFDFYGLRSDRIGRGPFNGSYWDLTVRDGQIVSGSQYVEIEDFSARVWEPFATWVSDTYPKDAAAMYVDDLSDFRLTTRSVELWEQHTKEYVKDVGRGGDGT
jgi:hypothetical protein